MSRREYNDSTRMILVRSVVDFRVSKGKLTHLSAAVNDNFTLYLLGIIEGASDDADDPYHYPVIRVLVCTLARALVTRLTVHS